MNESAVTPDVIEMLSENCLCFYFSGVWLLINSTLIRYFKQKRISILYLIPALTNELLTCRMSDFCLVKQCLY